MAWVVGGSLILADIYFNGAGVKRDIPLAMRFACEADEGMARSALSDPTKRNRSPGTRAPFEFCDYASTTFSMNFCGTYSSEIADDRRNRSYNSLKSAMHPEQQAAFEKLLAAEKAYIAAHASEVDQGGTIRYMRTLGSQKILEDLFQREVTRFEVKKWPELSERQVSTADGLVHREYARVVEKLKEQTREEIQEGAVTPANLSKAEHAWQAYRDAWAAFAQLRYPAAADAIRAQITLDRYRLLKTIP